MICLRIFILLIFLTLLAVLGKAQNNLAFYPIEDQFNSSSFNPAFLSSQKNFSLSFIPLGGTSIVSNNQAAVIQLVSKILSGLTSDNDYKQVLTSLVDRNWFNQDIESTLLSFTSKSRLGFLNFRIQENVKFLAAFKKQTTDFIFNPEIQSARINQIQHLPGQAIHYREYSLGYSIHSRMNRFSAGIRAKIYFGKAAFFSGISGSFQEKSNYLSFVSNGFVNISMPEFNSSNGNNLINSKTILKSFRTISYLMNAGNPGVGVDLGIKFRINRDLTFSMSVIDLGKINWKTNLNSRNFEGQYTFSNSSVTSFTNNYGDQYITKTLNNITFIDPIAESYDLIYDNSIFSKPLPVSVYTGLKYRLNQSLNINLVDRFVIIKDMNYNSFSIAANLDLNKKLSVSTGYSIIGNAHFNIPLAVLLKRDFGQIYFGTDNLTAFLIPSISEFAGFSFGTSFYLFTKRNLDAVKDENLPFYKPRKIKKYRNNGLIIKEYPEF